MAAASRSPQCRQALVIKVTFCVQGVLSPILANLFLHYAFDLWVTRHLPGIRFARYADDAVLHCKSKRQAEYVLDRIRERFQACKLELHPTKTRIVYCKDINRTGDHPDIQFTFLGYTFRPRKTVDKYGRVYVNFSPAVSRDALKAMRQTVRGWHLQPKNRRGKHDRLKLCPVGDSTWRRTFMPTRPMSSWQAHC